MTDSARFILRAAAVKLPASTTWIRTCNWSRVGVPGPRKTFDKLEEKSHILSELAIPAKTGWEGATATPTGDARMRWSV